MSKVKLQLKATAKIQLGTCLWVCKTDSPTKYMYATNQLYKYGLTRFCTNTKKFLWKYRLTQTCTLHKGHFT